MSGLQEIPCPRDLRGPIRYRRAALGYPVIEAADRTAGAYGLGYLHAIDRPVQVHLSLLAAEGRLMEFLGDEPMTRAIDRATRFFGFRSDAEQQVAQLNGPALALIETYCRGFNDSLSRRRHPLLLRLLRVPPTRLTPVSTILMYRLLAYFGLTSLQHTAELVVTELVARKAPRLVFDTLLGDAASGLDLDSLSGLQFPPEASFLRVPHAAGSNAFAVSAQKSATGGALLMGEFHMQTGRFPPVLYAADLRYADGDSYQGVGVPGLFFLAAGRTSKVAWSYTYGHADNIDVLVERCQNSRYQAGTEWRPFSRRVERVKVRGRPAAEEWTYSENEYGIILGDAAVDGLHPCVRWAGLRETGSDLNSVLADPFPQSAEEMAERHRSAKALSLGAVIADSSGRIAYVQTGRIDARPAGWTGAYPRAGWDQSSRRPDVLPEEARPIFIDPDEGFVVSANEFNRGRRGEWWSTLPEPIYRWERLRQVVGSAAKTDLNTLVRASYDSVDLCAKRLMAVWGPLLPVDEDSKKLVAWAANQAADPRRADRHLMGFFHALHHEVVRGMLSQWMPDEVAAGLLDDVSGSLLFQYHVDCVLDLSHPDVVNEQQLRNVLAKAWPIGRKRAHDAGNLAVRFAFVNEYFRGKLPRWLGFDTEVVEPPGGPTVPFQARAVSFNGLKMYFGPAFHMVFDMSRPGGWFHLPGGASEKRFGPGYGQGVQEWLTGKFFPLGNPEGPAPSLD